MDVRFHSLVEATILSISGKSLLVLGFSFHKASEWVLYQRRGAFQEWQQRILGEDVRAASSRQFGVDAGVIAVRSQAN